VRRRNPAGAGQIDIERICREHSLPLTTQRRLVLEALASRGDHPTVDEIWSDVRRTAPEISRTTVYRILEVFALMRVVRKVCHPEAVARYEIRADRHHHLLCLDCGLIVDFADPALDNIVPPGAGSGFRIEDYSIQFRGLCSRCSAGGPATEAAGDRGRNRSPRPTMEKRRKREG
jgi:Fur family peroxide stress response transcriptional regulator